MAGPESAPEDEDLPVCPVHHSESAAPADVMCWYCLGIVRAPQPVAVIGLAELSGDIQYAEIVTRGGVIRVVANVVPAAGESEGKDAVLVQVLPSTRRAHRPGDLGRWSVSAQHHPGRTEIALIREEDI
jgi:hypothetical protein